MSEGMDSVDALMAISIARLQGLSAEHHGSVSDACVHFEDGIIAGRRALATDHEPSMWWLMHDLVANLRLDLADTYGCMVRQIFEQSEKRTSAHTVMHGLTAAVHVVAACCAVLRLGLQQQLHRQDGNIQFCNFVRKSRT